jgi:dihydrofolate reductase
VRVAIIVAMDENRGIGAHNRLPWHLSADLKRFKQLTMGHHLIMGRKTFESIGRLLPGREFIILTRQIDFVQAGCLIVSSLDNALKVAKNRGENEVFIAGGGQVYEQALPLVDRIYLTCVHTVANADTFFPKLDCKMWREVLSRFQKADHDNAFGTTYKVLDREL